MSSHYRLLCSNTHAHTHTYVHIRIPIHITHTCIRIYIYCTHTYTTHVQGSFWKYLSRPTSEKFFHEIHNHFQEAQTEIKNCPMGLVIEQQGDSTRMVVSQPSAENSGGGAGPKKLSRSKLVSQLSMEQRDLQVCVWTSAERCYIPQIWRLCSLDKLEVTASCFDHTCSSLWKLTLAWPMGPPLCILLCVACQR